MQKAEYDTPLRKVHNESKQGFRKNGNQGENLKIESIFAKSNAYFHHVVLFQMSGV